MSKISRLASMVRLTEDRLNVLKRQYRIAKKQKEKELDADDFGVLPELKKERKSPKAKGKDPRGEGVEKKGKGKKKTECKGCKKASRVAAIRRMVAADTADIAAANRNNESVKKMIPGGKDNGDAGRISQRYLSEMKDKFAPQVKLASIRRDLDHLSYELERKGYNRFAGMLAVAAEELENEDENMFDEESAVDEAIADDLTAGVEDEENPDLEEDEDEDEDDDEDLDSEDEDEDADEDEDEDEDDEDVESEDDDDLDQEDLVDFDEDEDEGEDEE